MKAVILSRVSSKEQEEGHSLDAQAKLLKEYCNKKGFDIIQEFRIIESSTRGDRKEFKDMLKYISKQKDTIALISHKVDRLQRSFNEYHLLNTPLEKGKLELHFTSDNTVINKNSTSQVKMVWNMSIVMAQSYTDNISDNVKRSNRKKLEEGSITGAAPLGYLNITKDDGSKDVIFDPAKSHIVKRVFEDYSTGLYSLKTITSMATDYGLTSRNGKYLSKNTIGYMIDNPFYYGCMKNNNTLYPHMYPKLITKELWDKCQQIRQGKKVKYNKETKTNFIFTGLIKCKKCGCSISPEIKRGKYIYLRPNTKKGCDCSQINEKVALTQIDKILQSIKIPDELMIAFKEALKQSVESHKQFKTLNNKSLTDKLIKIEGTLESALFKFIDNSITKDEHDKIKFKLEADKANIMEQLKSLDDADNEFAINVEYMVSLASRAHELFESSGNDQKRRILNILFSNIYLDGKNLEFIMKKPFDKLVNLPKGLNWLR